MAEKSVKDKLKQDQDALLSGVFEIKNRAHYLVNLIEKGANESAVIIMERGLKKAIENLNKLLVEFAQTGFEYDGLDEAAVAAINSAQENIYWSLNKLNQYGDSVKIDSSVGTWKSLQKKFSNIMLSGVRAEVQQTFDQLRNLPQGPGKNHDLKLLVAHIKDQAKQLGFLSINDKKATNAEKVVENWLNKTAKIVGLDQPQFQAQTQAQNQNHSTVVVPKQPVGCLLQGQTGKAIEIELPPMPQTADSSGPNLPGPK